MISGKRKNILSGLIMLTLGLCILAVPLVFHKPPPASAQELLSQEISHLQEAEVPLHFNRFFPMYRLTNLPATPVTALEKAHAEAIASGLKYIYVGNVPGHVYNSTFCPYCGEKLIERVQFTVSQNNLSSGRCPFCGEVISGVW